MLPLRLVGIDMSDDASHTLGGGIRAFLGAGGFLAMMFGGYFLYESKDTTTGITLIASGLPIFLLPWMWDRLWRRPQPQPKPKRETPTSLQYLSNRDSDLKGAIVSAAWASAYGRWFAAQILVSNGQPIQPRYLIHVMAGQVMDKMLDGDIGVRGRRPGQMDYELSSAHSLALIRLLCTRRSGLAMASGAGAAWRGGDRFGWDDCSQRSPRCNCSKRSAWGL
jgi:hypothetical protein